MDEGVAACGVARGECLFRLQPREAGDCPHVLQEEEWKPVLVIRGCRQAGFPCHAAAISGRKDE